MISLSDAIERANLMSTDGSINQESYSLLTSELDDKDYHAFAMALVDRGIHVRTGSISITKKFQAVAQALAEDVPEGEGTDINTEGQGEGIPLAPDDTFGDIGQMVSMLEEAGIRLTPEGKVEFYKSTLPGLYTNKLPQNMDIPRAITYYEQLLSSHDNEESRINGMLDLLTRLTSQTADIQNSLIELENFSFNPNSKSEDIKNIAIGISNITEYINSGNWNAAQRELENLKQLSDGYLGQRRERYDLDLNVIDALDRMMDIFDNDPDKYQESIKGIGGISAKKSHFDMFKGVI